MKQFTLLLCKRLLPNHVAGTVIRLELTPAIDVNGIAVAAMSMARPFRRNSPHFHVDDRPMRMELPVVCLILMSRLFRWHCLRLL